eukprot:3230421-Pyramimonas_sp.AAC.1
MAGHGVVPTYARFKVVMKFGILALVTDAKMSWHTNFCPATTCMWAATPIEQEGYSERRAPLGGLSGMRSVAHERLAEQRPRIKRMDNDGEDWHRDQGVEGRSGRTDGDV